MRKPSTIEKLYLDFDGFFASVMQQAKPHLRGRPVGVIPFETRTPRATIVIACSKEAKAAGCKNVMPVADALDVCPELVLVPQRPDLFRRAHVALLNEISCEIPIETVKSIDELSCCLDSAAIAAPERLAQRIKDRLESNIGPYITCSLGFAANRLLAKIACKVNKPNGVTIWHPDDMPEPLLARSMDDVPGIGANMKVRLAAAGIHTTEDLWRSQPKHLRALWKSVNGERMWYAIHGYDIHAQPTQRGMFGHSRVLQPRWRSLDNAQDASRLLLTKAARRMRREGYFAGELTLGFEFNDTSWGRAMPLPQVQDNHAVLQMLNALWEVARRQVPAHARVVRVGAVLGKLTRYRQLDLFLSDDALRRKHEILTGAIDDLNRKFGKRVVTVGDWVEPEGGFAGGKIAYNRIPSTEDFI